MIAHTQMFTQSSLQKKITTLCRPWHIGRKWAEGVFHHECNALQSCGGFTKLQFVIQQSWLGLGFRSQEGVQLHKQLSNKVMHLLADYCVILLIPLIINPNGPRLSFAPIFFGPKGKFFQWQKLELNTQVLSCETFDKSTISLFCQLLFLIDKTESAFLGFSGHKIPRKNS